MSRPWWKLRGTLGIILAIVLLAVLSPFLIAGCFMGCSSCMHVTLAPKYQESEPKLRKALAYLKHEEVLPEIAWVEFDGNDVYIGFRDLPLDWRNICENAAFKGNRATDFSVHVWAVDAKRRGWRPGDKGYYDCITAYNGRIDD